MEQTSILQPLFALGLWTLAVGISLAMSRTYLMRNMNPQKAARTKDLEGLLPAWADRLADNYNHLFEQPVVFYAVVLAVALLNEIELLSVQLAWSFVVLRMAHSIVQITINLVVVRFTLYVLAWLVLGYMMIIELRSFI